MLAFLQRIGRSLMVPIAVMPAAALLLRLGQPDLLDIPFMAAAGSAIFDNLALLFAIGIAIGMSDDQIAVFNLPLVLARHGDIPLVFLSIDKGNDIDPLIRAEPKQR